MFPVNSRAVSRQSLVPVHGLHLGSDNTAVAPNFVDSGMRLIHGPAIYNCSIIAQSPYRPEQNAPLEDQILL